MVTLLTYVCLVGAMLGVLAGLAIRYRRELAVASNTICECTSVRGRLQGLKISVR